MNYKVLKEFISPSGEYCEEETIVGFHDDCPQSFLVGLLAKGFIEKIKDEPWKPKSGDTYYYTDSCGDVYSEGHFASGNMNDCARLTMGNCFQTKEQAEKAVAWLKAFKVLRDDTKGFKPNWRDKEQPKWQVYFDIYCGDGGRLGELQAEDERFYHDSIIYFATEAEAEESIKKHEKEWLTFLGIGE